MSKGKCHSLPLSTSGIYYSYDMHEALLKNDFPEFSGHLNIEEFFQWLFEVERFFEYRDISDKKKVKFVAHKLKKSAWDWWEKLQRMRIRLRKDPIESWEKMKKYLKRQFLPPDYQELLYQKYESSKQLGKSVSEFTNEFYRLGSYLDLNEPEAYNISRYMIGLCWAIRERLSSQSFYYLSDLVSAAKGIEQIMEREKTMKGRPQTLQHTTIEDVRYPVVSATQKYSSTLCNRKENASNLLSKVSSDQREYGHCIASKRMVVDFGNVIRDEDHVVWQQEEEPQ